MAGRAESQGYYQQASDWYDELYTASVISRNRYRLLALVLLLMVVIHLGLLLWLLPNQKVVPLLVNHYQDGRVDVVPVSETLLKPSQMMVDSDLVRYVVNRESFDRHSYEQQYRLIGDLSSPAVMKQYQRQQRMQRKQSPIQLMRKGVYRTVFVDSVVMLDARKQLAQVNYVVSDHDNVHNRVSSKPFTALLRWHYGAVSRSPWRRWHNWNGFKVDDYQREQRHAPLYH